MSHERSIPFIRQLSHAREHLLLHNIHTHARTHVFRHTGAQHPARMLIRLTLQRAYDGYAYHYFCKYEHATSTHAMKIVLW